MKHYYLSNPVYEPPSGLIDRDKGVIHGITVARVGPAKGHNGFIDKSFLLQLVELAAVRPQGIKARFGHPNMCATALGTYLGRFHNYAYHADKVTADLHLDNSAKESPHGNLFDYVLNMATSNPDMFGASVVFESDAFEEKLADTEGKKIKQRFFRLKELRATDIVDDPAASDGLFSAESIPAQATQWLDQNPELTELIFSKPENLIEFLHNYLNNNEMNLSEKIKSNFLKIFSLEQDEEIKDHLPIDNDTVIPDTNTNSFSDEHQLIIQSFGNFMDAFPDLGITRTSENNFVFQEGDTTQEFMPADMLDTMFSALTSLQQELSTAKSLVNSLSDKLSAKPTIPAQVSDPQISSNIHKVDKDETGKQILKSIPAEMRYRLSQANSNKLQPINP